MEKLKMSLNELKRAEEMATDLSTYLEEVVGDEWLSSDASHIARQLQESIEEKENDHVS